MSAIKQKIEQVLIESPYYGYKRVTATLRRTGERWNHKQIYRVMREYNLLQPKRRRKHPRTTDSRHQLPVYRNEIKNLPSVFPGLIWVSDITYVWVGEGFAYLALIMDQASRRIVGWAMALSLHRSLCLEALNTALENNPAPEYHHSDRGVQYASRDYVETLKERGVTPSMADVGVSVDNPYAEALNRSVKVEEVYLHAYESFEEARESIAKYVLVYNTKRLHSSLGYMCPAEHERNYYQFKSISKFPSLAVSN